MKLYRFSPIQNREELIAALSYVVIQTSELCRNIIATRLPTTSATVFTHYPNEYGHLINILRELGTQQGEVNGFRVILHESLTVGDNSITHLRVRPPDPYRMQVGCNDFTVDDYEKFKTEHLEAHPHNLRLIQRQDYEMIEFFDPDYDVFAYVLSKPIYI